APRALDLAIPIARFILKNLNRVPAGDTFCFSYTPLDHYAVHNANVLGASLLIRIAAITNDASCRDAALCSLLYSLRHQR
ncbi:hypothetical protein NL526_30085, partial [Klebsiella pneumoniae]|nr:hypothetical protein [Klebsiella pneumoniae]